jgi:hypothetical protein
LLSEGFEDVAALPGQGWVFLNQSAPPGSTGWFRACRPCFRCGGPGRFLHCRQFQQRRIRRHGQQLAVDAAILLVNGESFSFSLRLLGEACWTGWKSTLAATAPALMSAATTHCWPPTNRPRLRLAAAITAGSGLAAPASGRLAFRYVVDDTSLNGDYIGIDSVSVTAIPEPATVALVCLGAMALHAVRSAALAGNGGPVCRRPRRRPERMA